MTKPAVESQSPEIIEATVVRDSPRSPRSRPGWLPLVLALAALVAAGGLYFKLSSDLAANARHNQETVDALRAELQGVDARMAETGAWRPPLDQVQAEMDRKLGELSDRHSALEQQVTQALAVQSAAEPANDRRWLLREVEYLLMAAELRLQLERDVKTASAALEAADRRLGESSDPTLIPIREQVIGNLNALRALRPADISGLALALADIIGRAEGLPLKAAELEQVRETGSDPAATPESIAATPERDWRDALHAMWKDLVGLVDVKSMSVPDDVIFDPGKRYLLQQNLRLELAAARLELLRHDTQNFRASLARVEDLLDRYYDAQAPAVTAVMETLRPMREIELAPPLPTLAQPLALVRAQLDGTAAAGGPSS
ncbi:MAG: uroporphyrinogen-III C-methyltransferase [Chromatiales bacterium]